MMTDSEADRLEAVHWYIEMLFDAHLQDGEMAMGEPEHVDYPHEPGRLHDCPACDAQCHCIPGYTECVFEGDHNGTAVP